MYGGRDSGLTDLLERLPGRPWWWGAGLGLTLALSLVYALHGVSSGGRRIARPGDSFSDDNPVPPGWVEAQKRKKAKGGKKEPPPAVKTASNAVDAAAGENRPAKGPQPASIQPAPKDVGAWENRDFLRARDLGDSRLAVAVGQRARNPERTTSEAEMLALLLSPPPPAPRAGAAKGEPLDDPPAPAQDLVHAVTAALTVNDTASARQTLAGLLIGKFPGLPPQAFAEDAAAALLRQGSPEGEQIVFRQLVTAPAVDPQQEKQPPDAARREAIAAAVRRYGSARLRKLLAQAVIDGLPAAAQQTILLSLLCEPCPLNLDAQVSLYQSESITPALRTALEKQFVAASNQTLQAFLELTAGTAPAAPPTPDWHYRVGGLLWGPPLTTFLDVEHRALKTLGDNSGAVALALTIPNDAVRSNLRRTLSRHWSEGPGVVRAAGAPGVLLVEPGLLATLKSLVRQNQRAKVSAAASHTRPSKHSHAGGPRPRNGEAPRTGPDSAWDKLTQDLVLDYCRRCHAAVLKRAAFQISNSASHETSVTPLLPPPPGSAICAAYHAEWPGEHAGRLPQLADNVWKLDYQRIEERAKPSRPATYYRRQLKRCIEHSLPDGTWLDGLIEGGREEGVLSIDVLITHAGAAAGPPADEEQELTIQILSVDLGSLRE